MDTGFGASVHSPPETVRPFDHPAGGVSDGDASRVPWGCSPISGGVFIASSTLARQQSSLTMLARADAVIE